MAKKNIRGSDKDYADRTDLEKINTQWHKLTGLHGREEWSAAVVRAATAAEIAANLAVRAEFKKKSTFDAKYIDDLLKFANGLVETPALWAPSLCRKYARAGGSPL
jgi:hypothetical protein